MLLANYLEFDSDMDFSDLVFKIIENKTENLETHLLYVGSCFSNNQANRLLSFIRDHMDKYKIEKAMLTTIDMLRAKLITKEKTQHYCKGEEFMLRESVNDDLESLFEDIQLGKEPTEVKWSYFLPKLTKEQLKLVERKDYNFMQTFLYTMDADVDKAEMEASESDSKFVLGRCHRTLKKSLKPKRVPTLQ